MTRDTRRAWIRGTLLVATLALVAAGCGIRDGSQLGEAATTTSAPAPPPQTMGQARYDEAPCPFDELSGVRTTCGALVVPRDRAHLEEGTIRLAVAVLHSEADDPSPVPVVYLEGGPGGSALSTADWWVGHPVLDQRDLILLDQRGTGWSVPNLACDDDFEAADPDAGDTSVYSACAARLAERTDLADFTTREAAADVADLRVAMGYDQIDLWSISYGTRLAMVTMTEHPEGIRAAVLDSVYPPAVEALEEQGPNGEDAFEELFAACAEDRACADAHPDLRADLVEAMAHLDETTPTVDVIDGWTGESTSTEVTGADLVDGVFLALYDSLVIPDIPQAIGLAGSDDPDDVEEAFSLLAGEGLYDFGAGSEDDDDPPGDSDGLYYSVTCSEEMPITDLGSILEAGEDVEADLRDELTSSATYDVAVCKVWDAGQREAAPLDPVDSTVPALLLSGRFDPITPPRWARDSLAGLPNGWFFEFEGLGHGAVDSDDCPLSMALDFLDDPTSEPDSSCIADLEPPDFRLG